MIESTQPRPHNQERTTLLNNNPASNFYYYTSTPPNTQHAINVDNDEASQAQYDQDIDHDLTTPGAAQLINSYCCQPVGNILNDICCNSPAIRGPILVTFAAGRLLSSAGIGFFINEQTLLTIYRMFATNQSQVPTSWKYAIDAISASAALCDFIMNSWTRLPSLYRLVIKKKLPNRDNIDFSQHPLSSSLATSIVIVVAGYNATMGIFPGYAFGVHKIIHQFNHYAQMPNHVFNYIDKSLSTLLALSALINNLSYSQIKTLNNTAGFITSASQIISSAARSAQRLICCRHDFSTQANPSNSHNQAPRIYLPNTEQLKRYVQHSLKAFIGFGGIAATQAINYISNKYALAYITGYTEIFGWNLNWTPNTPIIKQLALYTLIPSFYSQFVAQAGEIYRHTGQGTPGLSHAFDKLPNKHKVTGSILGIMLSAYLLFSTLGTMKSASVFYNDHLEGKMRSLYGEYDNPLNNMTEIGLCLYLAMCNLLLKFYFEFYPAMQNFGDRFLTECQSGVHFEEADTQIIPRYPNDSQDLSNDNTDQHENINNADEELDDEELTDRVIQINGINGNEDDDKNKYTHDPIISHYNFHNKPSSGNYDKHNTPDEKPGLDNHHS